MRPLHLTILASIGGILAILGLSSATFTVLAPIGGLLFFYGLAGAIGTAAFPEEGGWVRWMFGLLGSMALVIVAGSAIYYAHKLDTVGLAWLLIATPWVTFALTPLVRPRFDATPLPHKPAIEKAAPGDSLSAVLVVIAAAADAAALRILWSARTYEALRTPWEVVPSLYFLWIGIATLCLAALAYRRRYPHLTLAALSLHLFAALAPAAVVYAVGYGFDPFVHQAAERLIAATGEITPKTPYYIGQYALVTTLAKLFRLPIVLTDRFLLPALAALFLPVSGAWLLRRGFGVTRHIAILGTFGLLLLPLASFASTTPQGMANLFFLLTLLLGGAWLHAHRPPLAYVLLLALAAAAIHPLAGVPALLAVAFLMVAKLRHDGVPVKRILKALAYAIILAAAAVAVPLTFSARQGAGATEIAAALHKPFAELAAGIPFESPAIETRYSLTLDFAEFANRNRDFLLFLLAGAGALLLARRSPYRRSALALGGLAIALFVSVAILKSGYVFQDVIAYEQGNYAARLYEAALLALSPLVLAGFAWWWRALAKTDASVRFFFVLAFAALSAALVYGSFPRLDDYRWSRGYSPSIHDVHAVQRINAEGDMPYVVLANQSVSAAALSEVGFKTYYGAQYFYSIPTGAPLYQSYLTMVYDGATRMTMEAAMRDIGATTAFFVVDDYWNDAPRIIAEAKKTADGWEAIDGGKVFIFRYTLR